MLVYSVDGSCGMNIAILRGSDVCLDGVCLGVQYVYILTHVHPGATGMMNGALSQLVPGDHYNGTNGKWSSLAENYCRDLYTIFNMRGSGPFQASIPLPMPQSPQTPKDSHTPTQEQQA